MELQKILLTHSHWDHIADVQQVKEHYQLPVYVHPLDAPNLQQPGADGLPCWLPLPSIQPDQFLEEGMQIAVGISLFMSSILLGIRQEEFVFTNPSSKFFFQEILYFKEPLAICLFRLANLL